jgi:NAD(P)-dependent dehydrogenase (short-subunit alcohol dehydrogenase family)
MSSNSLKGKVVAVTGAASGIGYATALKLLASGASITAGDINGDALHAAFKPLESQYPSTLLCLQVDTTKRSEIQRFIRETKEKYGQLNGYANVAGTGGHRLGHDDITETSDEEYDFIMDVNTRATFFTLSEVLRPGIIAEPNGSIVCVGSMFSQRGFKRGAVFAASKHAMTGMVKSAALEVGSRGIRVNTVLP